MDKLRWLAPVTLLAAMVWHVQSVSTVWGFVEGATRGADFASYYYAADAALSGSNPYDIVVLNERAERAPHGIAAVQPFFYPPPFLLLVAWAPALPLVSAYQVWFWINELTLIALGFALWRSFREDLGPSITPILALGLAASPSLTNLSLGQVNLPVMLAVIAGLFVARERPFAGGALVGWACMMKMSPALFVAWWMLRGNWRAVAGACGCAVVLTILSLPVLGASGQLFFYANVLPGFASGDYNGLAVPIGMWGNHSIPNLLNQWMPGGATLSDPARRLASAASLAIVAGLAWSFRRPPDRFAEAAQIAAIAVVILLTPVYTYEHHLVWGLPAFLVAGAAIAQRRIGRRWAVALLPAFIAWGVPPRLLKTIGQGFGDADVAGLAFAAQEAKFAALLLVAGLAIWLGSRPTETNATRESS